jgi:hypothetical protein
MEHSAERTAAAPARETDTTFRRLVEKRITVEEYVADLERRVEERENGESHRDTSSDDEPAP